jgi:hypothetical protein
MLLTDEAYDIMNKSFLELGTRPQVSTQIIKFLNSSSKETLIKKGVKDRTTMIMKNKRFLYKDKYDTTSSK